MYYTPSPRSSVLFVETQVFTRRILSLGLEEDLRALQSVLAEHPLSGSLDPGTGGLRKVRIAAERRNKGKRSGARVHYLYLPAHDVIYLLFVYGKDEQATLDSRQKRQLAEVARQIKQEWTRPPK